MKSLISLRVPATSANLGSGFDTIGMAVSLYNIFKVTELLPSGEYKIEAHGEGARELSDPKANLVVNAYEAACKRWGVDKPHGFSMWCHNIIPLCRGLGSSSSAVVAGVGTGGTIVGCGRAFKHLGAKVQMVAVEPAESPLLTQRKAGGTLAPAPHGIQGIGANFIPQVVDFSVIDRVESVSTAEATETSRRLAREEGILSGISCGAAVAAALRLAAEEAFADRLIVAILPDSGERYLSTPLFA